MVGTVLSALEHFAAAKGNDGEGAPAVEGGRGAAGELRESDVELGMGSAWAEEVWNGGSTVSSSSLACGWTAAVFWGFGAGMWRTSEGNALRGYHYC